MAADCASVSIITLLYNGSIYTAAGQEAAAQAVLCSDKILYVGTEGGARRRIEDLGPRVVIHEHDLQGGLLMPAFVDSHVHISMAGDSLTRVDLDGCTSLLEVQDRLRQTISSRPNLKRLRAKRFMISMLEGREPLRQHLDAVSPQGILPIYVEGRDLHSVRTAIPNVLAR